jgi:hypothetical protein
MTNNSLSNDGSLHMAIKGKTTAKQIFYVRAPEPDDRRSYISYYE